MSLFKKLFTRAPEAPLPTLEALAEQRGFPLDLAGLEGLRADFEHHGPEGRVAWADAVKTCMVRGFGLPPTWDEAQDLLMPELVPLWMAHRDGKKFWPLAEGLAKRVRVGETAMPEAWATLWGVAPDELLDRALDHLKAASTGAASSGDFERLPSGIYRSPFQDGHDAARLLLPGLWEKLFPGQNFFLAVPSRKDFFVAPQVLLTKLLEAVDKSLAATAPADRILVTLYQRMDGKLVPANLQDPHPIAQPQRQLRQTDFVLALEAQGEALSHLDGRSAPVGILPHPKTGRTFTVATWKGDKACFLPESDLVAFQSPTGEPLGIYYRQTFPRIPGFTGEVVDLWGPRRTRYEAFPTAEQLALLEQFADADAMAALIRGENPTKAPKAAPKPGPPLPGPGEAPVSTPKPGNLRDVQLGPQGD